MSNKFYYVSFREGDSISQESAVIMAVAPSKKKAERLLLDFFAKEKLPAFNYHTARKIIHGHILSRLTIVNVNFVPADCNKKEGWKQIRLKIDQTPLDEITVKKIYQGFEVVS
jgi:hypothetical protein